MTLPKILIVLIVLAVLAATAATIAYYAMGPGGKFATTPEYHIVAGNHLFLNVSKPFAHVVIDPVADPFEERLWNKYSKGFYKKKKLSKEEIVSSAPRRLVDQPTYYSVIDNLPPNPPAGGKSPYRGVRYQLLDEAGKVIKRTKGIVLVNKGDRMPFETLGGAWSTNRW